MCPSKLFDAFATEFPAEIDPARVTGTAYVWHSVPLERYASPGLVGRPRTPDRESPSESIGISRDVIKYGQCGGHEQRF